MAEKMKQIAPAKKGRFFDLLRHMQARWAYHSLAAIRAAANESGLSLTDGSLKVYLSEATAKGLIHDAGRGWYSRLAEPLTLDPRPVQKLIRATQKALPLLDFCAWSTVQLNPWLQHLLAQPVAFLYVPRDTLDSVGDTLRAHGWTVFVNPGKQAAREVVPGEKTVVLRPRHSKQPPDTDHHAAPEQVLVELLIETEALALMDASEARATFLAATESGAVKMAEIKRFAESKHLDWDEIHPVNQRQFSKKSAIG
jgi:hypothetical protein